MKDFCALCNAVVIWDAINKIWVTIDEDCEVSSDCPVSGVKKHSTNLIDALKELSDESDTETKKMVAIS